MRKILFMLLVLVLLAFAGCAETTETSQGAGDTGEDAVVAEATSDLISEADTVEIGEMLS